MINTMDHFASLPDIRVDGIEVIAVKYKTLMEAAKKKNYDILDHRKQEVHKKLLIKSCFLCVHSDSVSQIFWSFKT